MLAAQWAHRALLAIGIAVLVGVAIYAGLQGGLEWLWPGTQEWLLAATRPLVDRLPSFETVDRIARVSGATGTAMSAAFGVYTGLYYAKRNLPRRLKELLASSDERLLKDRAPLLSAITETRYGVTVEKSVFYVAALNRALGEIGFSRFAGADASLQDALREIEEQIALSNSQMKSMEEQKVAAHILRGSIASVRAGANARRVINPDPDRAAAEQEFTYALEVRAKDLDALELRGRQRDLRGNNAGALADFEALTIAANEAGNSIRAARGFRLQGKMLEQRDTAPSLAEARRRLVDGLATINAIGSLNQDELYEKGLLHEAYGQVQMKRNVLPAARQNLIDAIACFNDINTKDARDHEKDAGDALKGITPPPSPDGAPEIIGNLRRFLRWIRQLFG